eukprot:366030-Chlamydomonas_euryale.AAC.3
MHMFGTYAWLRRLTRDSTLAHKSRTGEKTFDLYCRLLAPFQLGCCSSAASIGITSPPSDKTPVPCKSHDACPPCSASRAQRSSTQSTLVANGFVSDPITVYYRVVRYGNWATSVYMAVVFTALVTCISIFKYFRAVHPGLALFSETMYLARRPLINILTVVLYILAFIAMTVWLIFSWMGGNANFSTFALTFISIVNLCLGFYDYDAFTGGRE